MTTNDDFLRRVNARWKGEERISFFWGMAYMALADKKVTHEEATELHKWLIHVEASGLSDPLMNSLLVKLDKYLSEGELSSAHAEELLTDLKKAVTPIEYQGEVQRTTQYPIKEPEPNIVFEAKEFAFTGNFSDTGGLSRETYYVPKLERVGAIFSERITNRCDYLVIGDYVSNSFRQGNYGRKIERAMRYREETGSPKIVSETHFKTSLEQELRLLQDE